MKSRLPFLCVYIVTFLPTLTSRASAELIYDVAADFSFNNNPNGAWTYGWSSSLAGMFTRSVDKRTFDGGLQQWMGNPNSQPEVYGHPSVFFNPNATPTGNGYLVPVNGVAFHPGLDGAHTAIKWTAQLSGTYNIASEFTKLHFGSTSIHIFKNDSELFTGSTGSSPLTFSAQLEFNAGDTLRFMAGSGVDGYFGDSTGVAARITAVPEPTSLLLVALAGLTAFRCRRRLGFQQSTTPDSRSTPIEQLAKQSRRNVYNSTVH